MTLDAGRTYSKGPALSKGARNSGLIDENTILERKSYPDTRMIPLLPDDFGWDK